MYMHVCCVVTHRSVGVLWCVAPPRHGPPNFMHRTSLISCSSNTNAGQPAVLEKKEEEKRREEEEEDERRNRRRGQACCTTRWISVLMLCAC